jgi:flagellar motor component MotA
MKKAQFFSIITIFVLVGIPYVNAYIDPGTGGMVIGSLWSVIVLISAVIGGFLVKYFLNPIKRAITKITTFFKNSVKEIVSAEKLSKDKPGIKK